MTDYLDSLFTFLADSPTAFHATENIAVRLAHAGYTRLDLADEWSPLVAGRYYVTHNDSSLVAMNLTAPPATAGFKMVGAHTDSPCLKVKPNAVAGAHGYLRLAVEVYGSALLAPWFDRDLGLAGRLTCARKDGTLVNRLLNIKQPVAFIPNLAIHLTRPTKTRRPIDKQHHLPAIIASAAILGETPDFSTLLLHHAQAAYPDLADAQVLAFELSLYDCQPPARVGWQQEFIASARLDNLLSCFAATTALTEATTAGNHVIILNDHEEVGSGSTSGAAGPFLAAVLARISGGEEKLQQACARAMLVSADNAHGIHPNFPDAHEPGHRPLLNAGPVIKVNHNQRYATNSESAAVLRAIFEANEVPWQSMVAHSNLACGTTIGPITATRLGVRTVDVGVAQLGMHSIREFAGVQDQLFLVKALTGFFDSPLVLPPQSAI